METLAADLVLNLRRETLNDREYLVVPVSLIVPGVLNGSQGPLLYPQDEIAKNVEAWNEIPLLIEHPKGSVPARGNPSVVVAQGVGILRNVTANGKLVGEAWHDVESLRAKGSDILNALEAGQKVEVSTGLGTENEEEPGQFNGTPYKAIARNYQPDHLAILPNSIGACSVADGCGLNVNELQEQQKIFVRVFLESGDAYKALVEAGYQLPTENAATKTEGGRPFPARDFAYVPDRNKPSTWKLRLTNVPGGSPDAKIVGAAVAALGKGFRGNKVEIPSDALSGVKAKVRRAWLEANPGKKPEDVPRVIRNTKGFTMAKELTKEQIINSLLENGCCWDEEDREGLSGLSDEKLKKLHEDMTQNERYKLVANAATKGFTDPGGNTHAWNEVKQEWNTKVAEKKTGGSNTVVGAAKDDKVQNALTEEQQELLDWAGKQREALRDEAKAKILGNGHNKLTEEQLNAMRLEILQNVAASIPDKEEKQQPQDTVPSYLGASVPTANTEEVQPMPSIDEIAAGMTE